jgi:soluble lytic murein transglycosylase
VSQLKAEGFISNDNPLYALSTKRLYYGYLAAGVLGKKPSLNNNHDYPQVDTQTLAQIPALKRAKALYEAGEITRAQVEWNLYVRGQSNQVQHAAAELAMSWQWYAKASQSAGWSGRYKLIDLRYPNAFETLVEQHANELELPAYWIYGVMRQESRYEQTAISPAGAIGLMQVMPATARQTASKHKLPYNSKDDLKTPEINIAIGSHYLRDLVNRFDHPVYATAAYNAGPSRVVTWRDRFPNDMTIWIESIPFNETRNYVKSVLAYSQIYAILHESDWHLASWTNPVDAFAAVAR